MATPTALVSLCQQQSASARRRFSRRVLGAGCSLCLLTALAAPTAHARVARLVPALPALPQGGYTGGNVTDPNRLALGAAALPDNASNIATHVDSTAQAVDHDTVIAPTAGESTQGTRYAALNFRGSLDQRADTGNGSIELLATVFPSFTAAQSAFSGDIAELRDLYNCQAPDVPGLMAQHATCAFPDYSIAFVVVTVGNVEFIANGFQESNGPAGMALARAEATHIMRAIARSGYHGTPAMVTISGSGVS